MAQSDKEKALRTIAKQIKTLDDNSIALQILECPEHLKQVRAHLLGVLESHGYSMDKNYKPFQRK